MINWTTRQATSIKKKEKKKKSNSLLTSNEQVATKVSVICCIPIIFRCYMYQN